MLAVICPSPLLSGLFPRHVASAELRAFRDIDLPLGEDAAHVPKAIAKRRNEFAAGRLCAAGALESLGRHATRVGREATGAPIWPAGVVGSISHTDDVAAAVVARSEDFQAIGLDIERVGAVEPSLWPVLFSETEQLRLRQNDPGARDRLSTALFAAKEAFYKAQWPITREWLDFLDVEIEIDERAFIARPRTRRAWIQHLGEPLRGLLSITDDIVAAAIFS